MIDNNSTKKEVFEAAINDIDSIKYASKSMQEKILPLVTAYICFDNTIRNLDEAVKAKAMKILYHTKEFYLTDQITLRCGLNILN